MKWEKAQDVVELLRTDTRLNFPALSLRRGFSSSKVEHLLNMLVKEMPEHECYLEIGVLEGLTLESAAAGNRDKTCVGVDPCTKWGSVPKEFPFNVHFFKDIWENITVAPYGKKIGLIFYDGDHTDTFKFMSYIRKLPIADEIVVVFDDWDRAQIRNDAFMAAEVEKGWRMLREMPEYTDGVLMTPHHFGYFFGVSVWGWRCINES